MTLLLTASILALAESAFAQSIPKPLPPEFSLQLVEHPYDVAPTTSIDPFTGASTVIQEGYHVENKSIEVKIKNQPFRDLNGTAYGLRYEVSWKGHFEVDWHTSDVSASCCEMYAITENGTDRMEYTNPNAPFTVVSFGYNDYPLDYLNIGNISDGGQIDFCVKALLGKYERVYGDYVPPWPDRPYNDVFVGEESEVKVFKTITIPNGTITVSTYINPNPTPSPTQTPTPTPTIEPTMTAAATPTQSAPQTQAGLSLDCEETVVVLVIVALVVLIALLFTYKGGAKEASK